MFKCGLCKKTIGPRVSSRVIELERRQVVYKTWNGKDVYGHEVSKSAVACIPCSTLITPEIQRNPKIVEAPIVNIARPRVKNPNEEDVVEESQGRGRKFRDSKRQDYDDESY